MTAKRRHSHLAADRDLSSRPMRPGRRTGRASRRSSDLFRFAIVFVVLAGALPRCDAAVGRGVEASEEVVARMCRLWEQQRLAIATARLQFRRFRSGGPFRPLSSTDVHRLIEEQDLVNHPDALRDFVTAVLSQPFVADPPWAVREFLWDGTRTRERGPGWDHVFDGTTELINDRANQFIKLYTPQVGESRWARTEFDSFRALPGDDVSGSDLEFVSQNSERVQFRLRDQLVLEASLRDGAIHCVDESRETGQRTAEILQQGFVDYGDGIVFPTLRIDARYRQGHLTWVSVQIVESAEFNGDLPETAFAMAAREGDLVRDRRVESSDRDYTIKGPVPDVMKVFGTPHTLASDSRSDTPAGFVWTVAVGLCLLALLVAMLWLRARRRA